jgi:hypothetical protein
MGGKKEKINTQSTWGGWAGKRELKSLRLRRGVNCA